MSVHQLKRKTQAEYIESLVERALDEKTDLSQDDTLSLILALPSPQKEESFIEYILGKCKSVNSRRHAAFG